MLGGADLYEALGEMLGEAGIDIEMIDLPPIVKRIAQIDPTVGVDFRNGAQIFEMRFEAEAKKLATSDVERKTTWGMWVDGGHI